MNASMRLRVTLPSGRVVTVRCDEVLTGSDWLSLSKMCEQNGKLSMTYVSMNGIMVGMPTEAASEMYDAIKNPREE